VVSRASFVAFRVARRYRVRGGALLAGPISDALVMPAAIWPSRRWRALLGLVVLGRAYETHPRRHRPAP
jgi:hypothetical protein